MPTAPCRAPTGRRPPTGLDRGNLPPHIDDGRCLGIARGVPGAFGARPHRLAQSCEEVHVTRLSLFSSPLLLGFDQLERTLDQVTKAAADGYPPYNVEQIGDAALRITLAVAGFTMDDLSVQVEGTQLVVRGKQEDDKDRVYLHRGIAARQFQRSFMLAEGIEVAGAWLDNGLLNIDLVRRAPEGRVRKVAIRVSERNGTSNGSVS